MLSPARGGPCVDSPITEAPRGPRPDRASGPSLGTPPCPRPGLGKSRFREPKKRFLPWALLAQLFQDPPTVEKGLCECSAGLAPHSGAHPSSKGKQERVTQGASHTAPLPQLRAAGPRDTEQRVQEPLHGWGSATL